LRREAEAKGFPSEKLAVHYIGVDTSKLTASTSHEREKTVLFVGRLVAQKGLTNLLRAMARGGESSAPAKLVVIGDGPLRAQHEAEAAELGVRADFLGGQPSSVVYDWMRRCSALVLPSFREGLGIVLCEAIALGLPVVGFASGGIPEVIAEGCGLLAAEGDAGDLGRQIALLLGNPELRGRLAANARRHLLKKFDLATQTQRLEQHYESLVAARSASAVVGTC
jgi:glycosyltransferase involved in cell wall biosynthesis